MRYWISVLVAAAVVLSSRANAQIDVYVGLNVGVTEYDFTEENATAVSFKGGLYFSPYVGIEADFINLGELNNYLQRDDLGVRGFNLAARAVLPVEQLEFYAKAGVFFWQSYVPDGYYEPIVIESGQNASLGAGVTYLLGRHLALNAEWQRFDLDTTYAQSLMVGVRFEF